MKTLIRPITLLFSLATIWCIYFLSNSGNASERATRIPAPQTKEAIEDDLVNPAACRHCRRAPCTCCEPVCCPKRVEDKEEKTCWKVVSELVCVPGFRFPWEKCCGPVCGWVRCVNVLEEHKYECDTCGYEWEVKYVCTNRSSKRERCRCPRCHRECH